ncbi:hypothetical protein HF638_24455 [Paenibacillus sp. SZ31]|uniref:hypothetical protein n=1 Tax=Paenibacillus sp. SZ31 TaxID=2725555 RepID=UPI00146BF22F|nr:hypothetical protein [Paenibacillus sp. SZ31]NMI07148.1 hypothetical protein [Paenibacillus sp. SZ31]
MRTRSPLIYTWKAMSFNAYMPILTTLLLILILIFNDGDLTQTMPVIELIFPLFGSWWSIFVLQDLLSEHGNELLFSLPVSRFKIGIFNVLLFFFLYVILLTIMLIVLMKWINLNAAISLVLQLSAQAFFYAGLGFLAMVLTRNTGWSLLVVTSYLSFQLLTTQTSVGFINIYLGNSIPIPISELKYFLRKIWVLSLILFINAQYWLSTTTKFK